MTIEFPVLSLIIFIPIIAGVLMLFLPKEQKDLVRGLAIAAAASVFILSLFVYLNYNAQVETLATAQANLLADAGRDGDLQAFNLDDYELTAAGSTRAAAGTSVATQMYKDGMAFEEYVEWLPQLGIAYHVGVDGLSVPMVLLTGMVAVAGVLVSWRIDDRTREFMAFFML
ncbi:MAG: hypothetical protein IAE80_03620, partial [Anaerolinea sp.]|nr:hypothetical protein [Anaerolinea sp.]